MNELKRSILKSDFYQRLKNSNETRSVELTVKTLESGIEEASAILNCPVYEIIYEVIESGSVGVFGIGQKSYRVKYTYAALDSARIGSAVSDEYYASQSHNALEKKDKDTEIIIQVKRDGVMLKVSPPKGSGRFIKDISLLEQTISMKNINDYDVSLARKVFREQKDKYVKIADWHPNIVNDGRVTLEISNDKMRAFVKIIAPKENGREIDEIDINDILANNRVTYGIKYDLIKDVAEKQPIGVPALVAEGFYVVNGENARINYKVNVEKKDIAKKIKDNIKIDYKDIANIENVVVNQVLAEKIPETNGTIGYNVYAESIEPKAGKDMDIKAIVGENTELAADENSIISKIDGQVELIAGKITVSPLFEVKGDVGPHTGNINFVGSVLVHGNVLDNYRIKAKGTVTIQGNVGKSYIESESDIIIKLGMQGREEGTLTAGGSVIAKFLQYCNVFAKKDVLVNELIMSSYVNADDKIIMIDGKNATATGGCLRALNEITVRTLGSNSSLRTLVEVGILPSTRKQIDDLSKEKEQLLMDKEALIKNIKVLEQHEKQKKLDDEKTALLEEQKSKFEEIVSRIEEIKNELNEISDAIINSPTDARINAAKEVFSGVKISVGGAEFEVRNSYKNVTFKNFEDNIVIDQYNVEINKKL